MRESETNGRPLGHTFVELGSGTSDKTTVLLDAMADAGRLRRYVPFDVSETTLREAGAAMDSAYPGIDVHGVVGDFEHHLDLIPHVGRRMVDLKEAIKAAKGDLKGILNVTDQPNVSIDFNHDAHSSTFHLDQTKVMEGTLLRVMSWYDNEWGFSNRMSDTAIAMSRAK